MYFNMGVYGFHFEAYMYELIRLIFKKELTPTHLFAPPLVHNQYW